MTTEENNIPTCVLCVGASFIRIGHVSCQGCSQDVKSQDQDETKTVNPQDRDETEMLDFPNLSRPRRSILRILETLVRRSISETKTYLKQSNFQTIEKYH